MLDGEGVVWGADARLTLSFAPDNTPVADESNALFAHLDPLGRDAWQNAILRGFQAWAEETDADIGVVADDGTDFGAPGRLRRDARFGDIRIGAIPLENSLFATSVHADEIIDGTWSGEVLFNTNYAFDLQDLFAVTLHEAGHVFGLEHTLDPTSPMFEEGIPTVSAPNADDVAQLHAFYGPRRDDVFDADDPNKVFEIPRFEGPSDGGTVPSFAYADIGSAADIDEFFVRTPEDYTGSLTIEVVTSEISLLESTLTVTDENGNPINSQSATEPGQDLLVTIPNATPETDYFIAVTGNAGDFEVGGYSLVVSFDDINIVNRTVIDEVLRFPFRHIGVDDLEEYFVDDEMLQINRDAGSNDLPGMETQLEFDTDFDNFTHYLIAASIESPTDVDRYSIASPEQCTELAGRIHVRVLDGHIADLDLQILDEFGNPLPTEVLINNADTDVQQINVLSPATTYVIVVSANSLDGASANYELYSELCVEAAQRSVLTNNRLRNPSDTDTHRMTIRRPQLLHVGFSVNDDAAPDVALNLVVLDRAGNTVAELEVNPGETRTLAILLGVGRYRFVVSAANTNPFTDLGYQLRATTVDDPLGPQANGGVIPFVFNEEKEALVASLLYFAR